MSNQFVGEIRSFGFNFAPIDWMQCNGQLLPISQYAALFSILGTSFGGNGTTNFGLPNLQGYVPMGWGTSVTGSQWVLGQVDGMPQVSLSLSQMPMHNHRVQAGEAGTKTATPATNTWLGVSGPANAYVTSGQAATALAASAISNAGSGLPHDNMQPYLTINFCVAITGVFPTRN
ncbi:MAG TPA: tail fiber protein [Xanthobacteraceae bacterium]|jgi:microcystin-dependent protein|nr:tail fiber protein [Xanthobacteraceae bacterium]